MLVLDQYGDTEQLVLSGRTGYDGLVLPPIDDMQPQVAIGDYTLKTAAGDALPPKRGGDSGHDYRVTLIVDGPGGASTPPSTPQPTPEPSAIGEVTLGEPFDLRLHDQVTVHDPGTGEGLQVEFTGIQQDSRCPSDVMCAWSGAVGLEFAATPRGGAPSN